MSKRIFITGYYGFGNTGDEAILQTIITHLRARQPELQITATSGNPEQTRAQHAIDAVVWSNTFDILESIRSSDLVVIGGGGLFHDYWGVDPNAVLTDNHSGIAFYTTSAIIAALYGKPSMIYAAGVGGLVSEHGKWLTKVTCDTAQVITVRDEGSRQLLQSIGIAENRIKVTADPVFDFPLCDGVRNRPKPAVRKIAVSLRNWNLGVRSAFWESEVATALDRVLQNEPIEVELLPFQTLAGSLEDDVAVSRRVFEAARHKDRIRIVDQALSPCELLARIAECDLMVGMRLHALIFGMLADVPTVALSYDAKVDQLMARAGLQDLCVDLKAVDSERLTRSIQEALRTAAHVRLRIQNQLPELQQLAASTADYAIDALQQNEPKPVPLTSDFATVLRRGLQTHISAGHASRAEAERLVKEVEFHLNESRTRQSRVDQLTSELHDKEVQLADTTVQLNAEIAGLRTAKDDLDRRLTTALRQAENIRNNVTKGLDRYHQTFQQNLVAYRNQKAWQIMLAIRKGYTLLFREGVGSFLGWIFTWPLRGPGNLAPYDLQFPDVWSYMPERLEASFTAETVASTTTASPAVDETKPIPATGPQLPAPKPITALSQQQKFDVVTLAVFNFEFRFQRPQQIATEFARRGHRVFWINPGRHLPMSHPKPYEAIELREHLWEIQLRGDNTPELYTGSMSDREAEAMMAGLTEVYKDFGIAENCAYLQFPFWRRIGLELRDRFDARVLYDCMDDWQNWTAEPRISDWNLEEERKLMQEADALVVTAQEFYDRQVAKGLAPILARNAADFALFSSPRENHVITDKTKPIVGYFGAIADWFDLDLITEVAKSRPQYQFVFIGHVYLDAINKLSSLPNVSMLGEKNYREIPLYLSHFNVCLIPFVLNDLIKGVDPVKMYEYFSQGKPVVATNMAEIAKLTDLLYVGVDAADFAAKLDQALRDDSPERRRKRIEYAKANTWSARVDAIEPAINRGFPKVSILVVTYNSEEFVEPFFDSITRNTAWPNYEVIVIDNNSTDNTREILERYAGADTRIKVTMLDRNAGFAGANNIAAKEASGEYLVFLNPDTIVTPGWIERMVLHCRRDSSIGAVVAMTNFSGNETKLNMDYENYAEMIQFSEQIAKKNMGHATDISVAALYCVLVPKPVWTAVGELDETFQVGMFEDDDFSLRVRKAGYRVVAAEDTFIHHFGNGSFAKIPSEQSVRIFEDNKKRFESKWKRPWTPHKLRSGVRPPFEELRISPIDFLRVAPQGGERRVAKLTLTRLRPDWCIVKEGFQLQPTGQSAIAIECHNATPGTIVVWDKTLLATWYGHPSFMTGLVPPELYAVAGPVEVYLMNAFGESNRLTFTVRPKS